MAIPVVGNVDPNAAAMPTFRCWDEDDGSEDDAKNVRGWEACWAAEVYAEQRYGGMSDDYPEEQGICVRDADGKVHRFVVHAVPTVDFMARPVEESEKR